MTKQTDDILERTLENILFEENGSWTEKLVKRLAKYILKSEKSQLDLQKRLILEAGEELNKEEFIEAHDNDTHRYQIPRSKREEWYKWCEIGEKDSEDPRAWDVPEWAERIDGMPTTDVRPYNQALTDYQDKIKKI